MISKDLTTGIMNRAHEAKRDLERIEREAIERQAEETQARRRRDLAIAANSVFGLGLSYEGQTEFAQKYITDADDHAVRLYLDGMNFTLKYENGDKVLALIKDCVKCDKPKVLRTVQGLAQLPDAVMADAEKCLDCLRDEWAEEEAIQSSYTAPRQESKGERLERMIREIVYDAMGEG